MKTTGQIAIAVEEPTEEQVVQYWERPLVEMVGQLLPTLAQKARFVQIGCQSGLLTQVLRDRCPGSSRLCLSQSDSDFAVPMQAHIDYSLQTDPLDPVGLSAITDVCFDGAIGLVSPFAFLPSIERVSNLVSLDGFVVLGGLLRDSCQEILDIFREVLEQEDLVDEQEKLDRLIRCLPSQQEVGERLAQRGFGKVDFLANTSCCAFPDAAKLVDSMLARFLCLDACMASIQDSSWRQGVTAGVDYALRTYFPNGVQLSIALGTVIAQRSRL